MSKKERKTQRKKYRDDNDMFARLSYTLHTVILYLYNAILLQERLLKIFFLILK